MPATAEHADSGWDDYAERVLRNEGRLEGLEGLVAETRESDRKMVEQRADLLAQELERRSESLLELVKARADALLTLSKEERAGDRREMAITTDAAEKRTELGLRLLREVLETALKQNYEQSREAITALEQRRVAATHELEQMVKQWRESDKEARVLFASDLARHLDALNHNNERTSAFMAASVTRELWQSEVAASVTREGLLRDQIIQLDRTVLTMTPIAVSDKSHAEIVSRTEAVIQASVTVLETKINTVSDKVAELKEYRDTTTGRSSGYSAFYGWIAGGLSILVTIIVLANTLLGNP